jgi:thiosulfate/3-mercaptopyruvate sulfurtransferase
MTPLITANQLEEIINSGENVLLCEGVRKAHF